MPDISMCQNEKCPSRTRCHRFTAKPSIRQSYFAPQIPKGKLQCEHFWKATRDKMLGDKQV